MRVSAAPVDWSAIDAVLIDLDGTLVDTLGDFTAALGGMLAELGLPGPLEAATVETLVGKGSEHLIRSALAKVLTQPSGPAGAPPGDASGGPGASEGALEALYPRAWQAYQAHYGRINGRHAQVYPGVQAGLAGLRARGLPLVCLTNKPQAFARQLLAHTGLLAAFVQVFGGDSFERKKPDPQPLLGACAALGTAPHRTLMVGDSLNDAQAARAAGCPVLLVSYGYNHGLPVRSIDADGYIDSLAELTATAEPA